MQMKVAINNFREILFVICTVFLVQVGYGQSSKEKLVKQREKLKEEIEFTSKLLESTSKKRDQRLNQVRLLNSKISQRERLISSYQKEIKIIDNKIEDRRISILKLEKELVKQKELYADFIRYSYKNHNHFSIAIYLLASENMNQFYLRKKYLEQLKDARIKKIALINKIDERIKIEIAELDNDKVEKTRAIDKIQDESEMLASERKSKEQSIKNLGVEEDELRKALRDKQKIEAEIEKRITELIKEEAKKSKFAKLTPEQQLISDDFAKNRGRLPWPTQQGVITEKFGEHWHPVIRGVKVMNSGIDITTLSNEPVRSIFDGEVSRVFSIKGADYTVIVRHGSYLTVYHNLTDIRVNIGDKVKVKTTLGYVSRGRSGSNSVVHFEIWKGLDKLNPEEWISK